MEYIPLQLVLISLQLLIIVWILVAWYSRGR